MIDDFGASFLVIKGRSIQFGKVVLCWKAVKEPIDMFDASFTTAPPQRITTMSHDIFDGVGGFRGLLHAAIESAVLH